MSIIEKLASEGRLSPEQVQRIQRNVQEFVKASESDVDFKVQALQKLGAVNPDLWSFGAIKSDVAKVTRDLIPVTIATALLTAAGDLGLRGTNALIDTIKDKMDQGKNFNKMMTVTPALKNYSKDKVQAAFDTLNRFNPSYASDPLVAGTFVSDAMDAERIDIKTINSLVSAREQELKGKPSGRGFGEFVKFAPKSEDEELTKLKKEELMLKKQEKEHQVAKALNEADLAASLAEKAQHEANIAEMKASKYFSSAFKK